MEAATAEYVLVFEPYLRRGKFLKLYKAEPLAPLE